MADADFHKVPYWFYKFYHDFRLPIVILFYFLSYRGFKYLFREKIRIEFDTESIYVTTMSNKQTEVVPFENVIKTEKTNLWFDVGQMYIKMELYYYNATGQSTKVNYLSSSNFYRDKFVERARLKNPSYHDAYDYVI